MMYSSSSFLAALHILVTSTADPLLSIGSGKGDTSLTGGVLRMTGARLPPLELGLPTLDPDLPAGTPGSDLNFA